MEERNLGRGESTAHVSVLGQEVGGCWRNRGVSWDKRWVVLEEHGVSWDRRRGLLEQHRGQ